MATKGINDSLDIDAGPVFGRGVGKANDTGDGFLSYGVLLVVGFGLGSFVGGVNGGAVRIDVGFC